MSASSRLSGLLSEEGVLAPAQPQCWAEYVDIEPGQGVFVLSNREMQRIRPLTWRSSQFRGMILTQRPQNSSSQEEVCRGARAHTRVEPDFKEFQEKSRGRKDEIKKGQRQRRARRTDNSLLFTWA